MEVVGSASPPGVSRTEPGPRAPKTGGWRQLEILSSLCEEWPASTLQVPECPAALSSLHRVSETALVLRAKVRIDVPVATKPVNVTLGLRHRWWALGSTGMML